MNNWRFVFAFGLFATVGLRPLAAADRPNVMIILADDQGWGDLSVHGNTNLSTPNIDSLARDGALFDRFFVCPVCSPTRAEFLTGRYHPRGGVFNVSTGGERLNLGERTIAEVFNAAGYATGAFGKWHNGTQWPYHPNARGFDEYYGFTSGHWGEYFNPPLDHNGRMVRGNGYITDDLTDHAMAFMEQNRGRPFFCYLPYNTPHSPMQVPDKYWDKFKDADLKLRYAGQQREDVAHTRAALAMCENIDWNVGRVLAKLNDLKLAENTIVLYFSDNGPNGWRWNGGMRGRKGSTDEGGVRSPLLVRWPGHIKPGTRVQSIAGAIDLLPTLAELCGCPITGGKPLDGKSLVPLLLGKNADWPDRMIVSHWNGRVSVRTQDYRLDDTGKLYDLMADPGQKRDITAEHPKVAAKLKQTVADWRKEVLKDYRKERPFTVGFREFPMTQLPARDGVPNGSVRRSANAPNCSYFTNWTNRDDRITWDVEVATPGRYAVEVHYTCARQNVGSTIELSLGDAKLAGKVTVAHDPPARGAEHDRVSRAGESYVKDFKPLALGEVNFPRGRGLLTLRATEIPGKQVAEVRMLTLTLLPDAKPEVPRLPRDNLLLHTGPDGKPLPVKTTEDWLKRREEILRGMQAVMGTLPGREKRCPLAMKVEEEIDCGSYVRRLITYASEPGSRVPAYLCVPKAALQPGAEPVPATLCLHGTDNVVGHGVVVGLGSRANRAYAAELAERGYVTLAPNYPLLAKYQPDVKALRWESGTLKAVWDNMRGLDLLESLPFVKKDGFGTIGHSLGGHNSVYTAAFDDRLKVVVSSCGLDSFLDYYNGDEKVWLPQKGWTQTRYMPRLADYRNRLAEIPFDFHEVVGALAPRSVFIIAPKKDHNFRADSVDRIAAAAGKVFQLYGHPGRLRIEHPDCEHDFPPDMRQAAYAVMDAVLR